jgi:hypothetical protein
VPAGDPKNKAKTFRARGASQDWMGSIKQLTAVMWAASGLWGPTLFGQAPPHPDALEIVRHSIDRDWTDFDSRKQYTYQEHYEQRAYTSDGRTSQKRSETKEILILGDWPYERLIARDDKPLSSRDALREQQKLDRTAAERQHESASQRARRERERAEDRKAVQQLPNAFTFRLEGVENVSGRPAWVIDADPKPGFNPTESFSRIFKKVRAKAWIEQETYHWVKLDAEVLDTLTFGFGLLRVAPGGTLHFEQTRVNNEIWLPSSALIRGEARLALVKKLRTEIEIHYSGYRKFQADSKIVETKEP